MRLYTLLLWPGIFENEREVLFITHRHNWSFGVTLALKFLCSWIRAENKTQVPDYQTHTLLPKPSYLLPGPIYTGVLWKGVNIKIDEGTVPANKQDDLSCTCWVTYSHTPHPRVFRINSPGVPNPHQGHWKAGAAEGARARMRADAPPHPPSGESLLFATSRLFSTSPPKVSRHGCSRGTALGSSGVGF